MLCIQHCPGLQAGPEANPPSDPLFKQQALRGDLEEAPGSCRPSAVVQGPYLSLEMRWGGNIEKGYKLFVGKGKNLYDCTYAETEFLVLTVDGFSA